MESKEKALSDLNVIKEALNKSKTNSQPVKNIFFVFGTMNMLLLVMQFITHYFILDLPTLAFTSNILSITIYLLTTLLLVRISRQKMKDTNRYYRLFLSVFLMVSIGLPLILLITRMISGFRAPAETELFILLNQMSTVLNIFLFSISLLIVGSIKESRMISSLSVVNLLIFFLLLPLESHLLIENSQMITAQYSALYSGFILSLGYIFLGTLLNKKGKS